MLQNRVNPFGQVIRTAARGHWLGNRGLIHNERKEVVRAFKHKAWIICLLSFKGRHRTVMSPGLWTELFFFDEATAFAAGHRPCFECRREDAVRFKRAWLKGNPAYGFDEKTRIGAIDEVLHAERVTDGGQRLSGSGQGRPGDGRRVSDRGQRVSLAGGKATFSEGKGTFSEELSALPNGAFIELHGEAYVVFDGLVYRWSPEGYAAGVAA
ncbi:MAG TPA: hypothetical protein VGM89_00505, partial [Puia sp.]